jgi:hypothetical protein
LCQFHHGLKTGGLWDTEQQGDGTVIWTSPTGRIYETQPRQWPTETDDEPMLLPLPTENSDGDGEPTDESLESGASAAPGTLGPRESPRFTGQFEARTSAHTNETSGPHESSIPADARNGESDPDDELPPF